MKRFHGTDLFIMNHVYVGFMWQSFVMNGTRTKTQNIAKTSIKTG